MKDGDYQSARDQRLRPRDQFGRLDLDLVTVSHHPENDQSARAIKKYVGRREGLLRNHLVFEDDTVVDMVRYSIAQEEFRQ